MQFPWMMYSKGPGLALPRGQSVSCQVALDETEYAAAIKAGWFPSVPEALAETLDQPVEAAPVAEKPAEAPAAESVADAPQPAAAEAGGAPARRGRPRKS